MILLHPRFFSMHPLSALSLKVLSLDKSGQIW